MTSSPARPPRRRSRFLTLIGLALLTLYVGAIGAVSYAATNLVAPVLKSFLADLQDTSQDRVSREELARVLPGVPLYPGARLNESLSNNPAVRLITRLPGQEASAVFAFDSDAPTVRVTSWYRENLRDWRRAEAFDDGRLPFDLPAQAAVFTRRGQLLAVLPGIGSRSGHGFFLYASGGPPRFDVARLEAELRRRPGARQQRRRLAEAFGNLRDYERALPHWRALAKSGGDAERAAAQCLTGHTLMRLRRAAEAATWFRSAAGLTDGEERVAARLFEAQALKLADHPEQAETILRDCVSTSPKNALAHALLARVLHEGNRLSEASDHYALADRLLRRPPDVNRIRAEVEQGHLEQARELLLQHRRAGMLGSFSNDAKSGQPPQRAWVGITMETINETWARSLGLPAPEGVWIDEVVPHSPAYHAGLRGHDAVLAISDRPVHSREELSDWIRSQRPGTACTITAWRSDGAVQLQMTLGALLTR